MLRQNHLCIRRFAVRCLPALLLLQTGFAASALDYPDNKALAGQLKELARTHKKLARVESAAKTPGKRDVWRLELGSGTDDDRPRRPAMLVVAGIEGNDLAGSVSVVAWAESLAKAYESDQKIKSMLDSTTIYIWPRLNPDAVEHGFAKPRRETSVSNQPWDDDHDGLVDEDGPEDLNGDGLITWMRVADADGEFIPDPVEPRLLMKADHTKGERGAWRLLAEGRDNDGDKEWNEDGLGGVNFNRNFPYSFRFFAPWAGRHQVSEVETRALADFVVSHPNIGIVFTFGAADNLVQTPKGEAPKRPPVALHEDDVAWYRESGKAWREALGLKKEMTGSTEPGTFSDWMYFHRGRLSLAARPWSPAIQIELAKAGAQSAAAKDGDGQAKEEKEKPKADSDKKEKADEKPGDKATETDKRNEEDRAFLKWLDANAQDAFVPWKEFNHPDFPGQKVEIGGFAPFAKSNPPRRLLEEFAARHGRFLTDLAGRLPRIAVRKIEAKHLGEAVYDVKVSVENSGYLPTSLAQGSLTREVHPTRVVLKTEERNILSGSRTTALNAIAGGDAKEVRWIVRAKGVKKLEIEIISMLGGRIQTNVELKEEAP
jgi:murein tripeptide amidase MpaA